MKKFSFVFSVMAVFVFALGAQAARIQKHTHTIPYTQKPFEQSRPGAPLKILFLGDSTAVGTGTEDPQTSVAGWMAKDFPQAHIVNRSANGRKLAGVLEDLTRFASRADRYQLIVIQAGANDILRFTSWELVKEQLRAILERSKGIADHVVILHSADVGTAPIFTWPLNWIYSWRSRTLRQIYLAAEQEQQIFYIDLLRLRTDDILLQNIPKYYSPDHLHLSGEGYRVWYEAIRTELQQSGVWQTLISFSHPAPSN